MYFVLFFSRKNLNWGYRIGNERTDFFDIYIYRHIININEKEKVWVSRFDCKDRFLKISWGNFYLLWSDNLKTLMQMLIDDNYKNLTKDQKSIRQTLSSSEAIYTNIERHFFYEDFTKRVNTDALTFQGFTEFFLPGPFGHNVIYAFFPLFLRSWMNKKLKEIVNAHILNKKSVYEILFRTLPLRGFCILLLPIAFPFFLLKSFRKEEVLLDFLRILNHDTRKEFLAIWQSSRQNLLIVYGLFFTAFVTLVPLFSSPILFGCWPQILNNLKATFIIVPSLFQIALLILLFLFLFTFFMEWVTGLIQWIYAKAKEGINGRKE